MSKENEKKPIQCFLYSGSHRVRDCLHRLMLFAIVKEDEVKPDEEKVLRIRSMILQFAKEKMDYKQKGLMFVDINIIGQRRSALVDTEGSDLFLSEKATGKLGLSVIKSNKRIKVVYSKKVPIVEVA
ncbi:hypothetical protein J1N35_001551 [Gossypium stocksii]|uniref:Uncharacterized protein n=1 Tax=Gossypium stocksii TaxID=47602 RepID=A0A9D4AM92_9ROSI|nr:hypothetical protein J1N35_001551 [Gossypium stocksii]